MSPDTNIHDELKDISPLLAGLPKSDPRSVPDGYFDGFAERMLAEARQAPVVKMDPVRRHWRFAAAAVTVGVAIFSWFVFTNRGNNDVAALQSVQQQISKVPDAEIAAFVDGTPLMPSDEAFTSTSLRSEDVPLVLSGVSDQELQQYLEEQNAVKMN